MESRAELVLVVMQIEFLNLMYAGNFSKLFFTVGAIDKFVFLFVYIKACGLRYLGPLV
jgi:hypothetical protein